MKNRTSFSSVDRSIPSVPDHCLYRCIGRGGSGEVWLAQNSVLGQWRAVKVVRDTVARTIDRELRGWRNYEPVSRAHPGLMAVLQVGTTDEGWLFAVMELADNACVAAAEIQGFWGDRHRIKAEMDGAEEGHRVSQSLVTGASEAEITGYVPLTLSYWIDQRGRIPVRDTIGLGLCLLEALGFLHAHKLVHRDVKPSNIILSDGSPKLSDPGLVAGIEGTHSLVGTLVYTPSEDAGTPAADLFALGKVLYAAAAGRNPEDVAELPTVSLGLGEHSDFLELQEVLFHACSRDPKKRYRSAVDMRRDLERILEGTSLRQQRRIRRWARIAFAGAVMASVLLLAVGGAWRHEAARNRTIHSLGEENRRQLVDVQTANGTSEMQNGSLLAAATWFGEALKSTHDAEQEKLLRYRIESCLGLGPNLVRTGNHQRAINEANFSPDGSTFVTVSDDGTARIWNTATGQDVVPPMEHGAEVNVGQFSTDGRRLVTGCADGTVRVWETATGKLLIGPLASGKETLATSFSPDGRRILAADRGGEAMVWEVATGALAFPPLIHRPTPQDSTVNMEHASFSPDGRWLVTAGSEGEARIWQAATGKQHGPAIYHAGGARYAAFSASSQHLATAGTDGIARVWDVATGTPVSPPIQHVNLYFVAFSPDGLRLLTAGGSSSSVGEARVWDATTGTAVSAPIRHQGRVRHAAFSPDGRWVATASQDTTVQLLDTLSEVGNSKSVRLPHQQFVWSVAFSPKGDHLLTAGREAIWRLWSLWGLNPPQRTAMSGATIGMALAANDLLVTSDVTLPGVKTWNIRDGRSFGSIHLARPSGIPVLDSTRTRVLVSQASGPAEVWRITPPELIRKLDPLVSKVFGVGYSDDRHRLVTLHGIDGPEPKVAWQLWRGDTLEPEGHVVFLGPLWAQARRIAMNRQGSQVAVVASIQNSYDRGLLAVYNTESFRSAWSEIELPGIANQVAFSPDGSVVVCSCGNVAGGQPVDIYLYDSKNGNRIGHPMHHPDGVSAVAFSPDGRVLATGDEEGNVQLWRVPQAEPIGSRLNMCNRGVGIVVWAPDGQRIVTSFADYSALIWDPKTGEILSPMLSHNGDVVEALFSDDGNVLVTSATDGLARTWPVVPTAGSVLGITQRIEKASGLKVRTGKIVSALEIGERRVE